MVQTQQNIMALITELDAAQDEASKASASSRLLVETFKALVLGGLKQEAFEEMATFSKITCDCQGKSKSAISTSLSNYRAHLRSTALDATELF